MLSTHIAVTGLVAAGVCAGMECFKLKCALFRVMYKDLNSHVQL